MDNQRKIREDIQELSDAAKVLDAADVRDKNYFKDKWTEFLEVRDWSTESFKQDHSDLKSEIKSVENNIKRLQDEVDDIRDRRDSLKSEYNDTGDTSVEDLENKNLYGKFYPSLGNLKDSFSDEIEKRRKIGVWKAFQTMLDRLGRLKMHKVALSFENKYRTIEEVKSFEEAVDNRLDEMRAELREFAEKKINEKTHQLEKATEATRREMKAHRSFLDNFGTGVVQEIGRSNDSLEQILSVDEETELADLTDDQGFGVNLDKQSSDASDEKEEFDEAKDSASETGLADEGKISGEDSGSSDENVYALSGKSVDEKHKVLQEMAEEEELLTMSPQKVADKTDVTRPALIQDGGILDKIEEEYSTRFGID